MRYLSAVLSPGDRGLQRRSSGNILYLKLWGFVVLGIFGLIIIVAVAIHTYRTAKEYGRNAAGWTLGVIGVGLGFQVVLPLLIIIVIGVVLAVSGTSEAGIEQAISSGWGILMNVVSIVISFVAMLLILRFVAKIPEDLPDVPPPAPPKF